MVKEIWKKVIWPVMTALFLAVVFRPLCMAEDGIDYWKLLFLMGIPFGVQKMFVWLIPSGYGIGETVGIFALNLLVGGIIGGFILVCCFVLSAKELEEEIGNLGYEEKERN